MPSVLLPLALVVFAAIVILRAIQRSDGWIEMSETLFWDFVAKHAPAEVLVVLRGTVLKRSCYVYAHQGIVLFTWSRPATLPAGVTETLTFELETT